MLAACLQRLANGRMRVDRGGAAIEPGLVAHGADLHGACETALAIELHAVDALQPRMYRRDRQRTGEVLAVPAVRNAALRLYRMHLGERLRVQRVLGMSFVRERIRLRQREHPQGVLARHAIDMQAMITLEGPHGRLGVGAEVTIDPQWLAVATGEA